uniref:Tetratricopeptide repeat protein 36 n=1 Tax=Eptatretus burgeri TaxID=7764 RepID=A0A8C4N7B1_EPTBU
MTRILQCSVMTEQDFDMKLVEEAKCLEWHGVAYAEDGNVKEAISLFSRAIRVLPTRASAYNNRAQALRLQGDNTEAMADLDKAIELSRGRGPAACQAFVQRGLIHRLNGSDGGALQDLRRAATLGSPFARRLVAQLNPYAALCNRMLAQAMSDLYPNMSSAKENGTF